MNKLSLQELINQTLEKMKELNFAASTIKHHQAVYGKLLEFAHIIPTEILSEELAEQFLEKYGSVLSTRTDAKKTDLGAYTELAAPAIRKLCEYQLYGMFYRRPGSMKIEDWVLDDYDIMMAYGRKREPIDSGKTTMIDRLKHLRHFYCYIESIGLRTIKDITPDILTKYPLTLAGYAKVTIKHRHKDLRQYLRFLHTNEYLCEDFSSLIPRVTAVENKSIPMIWTEEDISELLDNIDLSSPVGKRDYAILLLCIELGIRACDINSLKLSDFDWNKKIVNIMQEKTSVINSCPLTDRAGWAVINYIRYGRPMSDLPYLFLTCNAPYTKLGSSAATSMLKRRMQKAGIEVKSPNSKAGIHTLRHTFAVHCLHRWTQLGVPLSSVLPRLSTYLGHNDMTATERYLRMTAEIYPEISDKLSSCFGHIIPMEV